MTRSTSRGVHHVCQRGHAAEAAIPSHRGQRGRHALEKFSPQTHLALDPRVAFLGRQLAQGCYEPGHGRGSPARGFTLPAAGKTGTSRDDGLLDHFQPLCVIWIGFDDNRDLGITGGVWPRRSGADFMTACHLACAIPGREDLRWPERHPVRAHRSGYLAACDANCPTTREKSMLPGRRRPCIARSRGHNLLSSAGSVLSRSLEESPKRRNGCEWTAGHSYDPTGRQLRPATTVILRGKEKESFTEDFWYLWGKRRNPTGQA